MRIDVLLALVAGIVFGICLDQLYMEIRANKTSKRKKKG